MKLLKIPHQTADYLCPVNGLCDIYEWKTGNRIPEELLFFSRPGFQMISQKRANPPKMIFWGQGSIGKDQFNYWRELIGYNIIAEEGKSFRTTREGIKSLIDQNIPVVVFGLDMYYLPYHTHYYNTQHIPGHVVLMVGYDNAKIYIHDNSKQEMQSISWEDLQQAWANDYIGICKKNAYFGIDMTHPNKSISSIIQQGLKQNAILYLHSPVNFIGKRGLERFIRELPTWKRMYPLETMKEIYLHLVQYAGSTLPEIPEQLSGFSSGVFNPHQGGRDKIAAALNKYKDIFGSSNWIKAVESFSKSGQIIDSIIGECTKDIYDNMFSHSSKYIPLLKELQYIEHSAFTSLEAIHIPSKRKIHEQIL